MTNKTKLSAAALFSALVLGGSSAGSTVFADAKPGPDPKGGSVSEVGHAYVTFTKDGTTPIHDPSNPGSDITPSNPNDSTNETGELTLDAIPSQLNFGTQESQGAGQVTKLLASTGDGVRQDSQGTDKKTSDQAIKDTRVIFTQVTNVATTNPSWSLSATMGEFTNADGTNLPGAFITFGGGVNVLDKFTAATADQAASRVWTSDGVDDLTPDVQLTAGSGSAKFITSKQTGTFQQQWKVADVTLTTPQAPAKGDYTSEINWTLTAAPDDAGTTTTDTTTNPGGGA